MKCETKSELTKKLGKLHSNFKKLDQDVLKLLLVDIPGINTTTKDFKIIETAFRKNNKLYTLFRKEVNKIFPDKVLGMNKSEFIHHVSKILYGVILYSTQNNVGGAMVEYEEKDGDVEEDDILYEGDDGLVRLPAQHRRRNMLNNLTSFLSKHKGKAVVLAMLVASVFVLYTSMSEFNDLLNYNLMAAPLEIIATLADSNPNALNTHSFDQESTAAMNELAVVRKGHSEVFKPLKVRDVMPTPEMGISIMSMIALGSKSLVGRDEMADAIIVIGKKYSVIVGAITNNLFKSGLEKAAEVPSVVKDTVINEALKKRSMADKIANAYNPGRFARRTAMKAATAATRKTQDIGEDIFIDTMKFSKKVTRAFEDEALEVSEKIENVTATAQIGVGLLYSALSAIAVWAGCGKKKRRRRQDPRRLQFEQPDYYLEDKAEGKKTKKHKKHTKGTKKHRKR
jgi:hypothetical protein